MNPGYLFANGRLREILSGRHNEALSQVLKLNPDVVLNGDLANLAAQLFEAYRFTVPEFDTENISFELIPQNLHQSIYKYRVPFEGDSQLFLYTPSSYWHKYPRAQVEGEYLAFGYTLQQNLYSDADVQGERLVRKADALFDEEFEMVNNFLGEVAKDVQQFHGTLTDELRSRLANYKNKIRTDRSGIASSRYALHKRSDADDYVLPLNRKPLSIASLPGNLSSQNAILEMAKYEEVLATLTHMSHVIERNPTAFALMEEEDLRHFFLLMLNAIYEGKATGETFNADGKTDILIREADKNIFIAECKFWRGPKGLTETINQLLGYTSWNDTKTAIVLFNRNKNFTSVLQQISAVVQAHINWKRTVREEETKFQYVFCHRDDPEKELWLTVVAFDVPIKP